MKIRLANQGDIEDFLRWRNDPVSVAMFSSEKFIDWSDHERWFQDVLADESRLIYVGIQNDKKIGMCRFDIRNDTAEVSINLDPNLRGEGRGKDLLRLCCESFTRSWAEVELRAKIKKKNLASYKCFFGAGFTVRKLSDSYIFLSRRKGE